jgi:hypothetical protein
MGPLVDILAYRNQLSASDITGYDWLEESVKIVMCPPTGLHPIVSSECLNILNLGDPLIVAPLFIVTREFTEITTVAAPAKSLSSSDSLLTITPFTSSLLPRATDLVSAIT